MVLSPFNEGMDGGSQLNMQELQVLFFAEHFNADIVFDFPVEIVHGLYVVTFYRRNSKMSLEFTD